MAQFFIDRPVFATVLSIVIMIVGGVALVGMPVAQSRAARHADCAGEAEAGEPAREIAAEFVLNVSRHGPLGGFSPREPTLEVLGNDVVERRLLGATPLVTACGTASPRGAAGSPGDRSGGSWRRVQRDQESGTRPGGVPRGMASAAAF